MSDEIEAAARLVRDGDHVVAFTGAGVSTASGIPDFRSDGGIWEQFDPAEFHYQRFKRDPGGFWEKRIELYDVVFGPDIEPNGAHEVLARLEERGTLETVITQNIDGLHHEAGSESVLEIHGNGQRVVCEECGRRDSLDTAREQIRGGELPPRCRSCAGVFKPDVVLFGETLPEAPMQQAQRHAREADVFLSIGSSLSVEPAASLPRIAHRTGGSLGLINLDPTGLSDQAAFDIRADIAKTLPAIEEMLYSQT